LAQGLAGRLCMGCGQTTAHKSTATSAVLVQPQHTKVRVDDVECQVSIISASVAASILLTHTGGEAVAVLDARPKEAFQRCHIRSAWNIDASPGQVDEQLQVALKSRCGLRSIVVYGEREPVQTDPCVITVLQLLHRAKAKPKGLPLLLSGGIRSMPGRFSTLLLSTTNGQQSQQSSLPVGPAEILEPDPTCRGRPQALYLGTDRCVHGADSRTVLTALRIQTIFNLSGERCAPPGRQKIIDITEGGRDAEAVQIARAQRTVEKLRRETGACMLYGAGSDVAAAQYILEQFPSLQTADEALAYIRLRFPRAELGVRAQNHLRAAAVAGPKQGGSTRTGTDAHDAKHGAGGNPEAAMSSGMREQGQCHHVQLVWRDLHAREPQKAALALSTLRRVCQNILNHPKEIKYRRLKATNARVRQELLAHAEVVELFYSAGFVRDEDGDLVLPLTSPLQALRDLLAWLPGHDL